MPGAQLDCQSPDGKTLVLNRKIINLAKVQTDEINQHIVFLPLKAYQILPALKQYSDCLANNSTIVLLHNGMIDLNEVKKLIPDNPIIAATTSYGAFKPKINKICITAIGSTQAGWIRRSANAELIEKLLDKMMQPCDWRNNIQQILWQKLAINAVINPLTALHNVNNGELNRSQYRDEIAAISNEVAGIMNRLGYDTSNERLIDKALQVITATATNLSSMHQDIANGRHTEIDNINGYICVEGLRLGIPTPVNQELLAKIKRLEGARKN